MKKLLILLTIMAIPLLVIFSTALVRSRVAECDLDRMISSSGSEENPRERVNICVSVVSDDESRFSGLTSYESLAENEGMLFIFNDNVRSGFWMKDMKFPIDILFIDESGVVSDIKKDFKQCENNTDCTVFTPDNEYMYALEVNSGYIEQYHIKIGDSFSGL